MTRLLPLFLVIFAGLSGPAIAQTPQGEFRAYYQRLENFDFRSGSSQFEIIGESFDGGGFNFVFNLNDWLGFFSETNFLSGAEEGGIGLSLINQIQGAKLTAREIGPLNLYAKGGIGFTRFVFDFDGFEDVRYQTGFAVGGGIDLVFSEGIAIFVEESLVPISLPDLTGVENRDSWDSSLGTTIGIAFFL